MTKISDIQLLVDKQLIDMCEKHKQYQFNSEHEKYAVTLEESEEAEQEFADMKDSLVIIWNAIKNNNNYEAFQYYKAVKQSALQAIQELIQVCACCDKKVMG